MALMCRATASVITETIFENRFMHVAELQRMGADIKMDGHSAIVKGVRQLDRRPGHGHRSPGLRLAGYRRPGRQGKTEISRIYHLDRGYDNMVGKLVGVGAVIRREAE